MGGFKFKQVIVVRGDVDMSVGKLAAQVAHASLSAYERCREEKARWAEEWLKEGQAKIVCEINNLDELRELVEEAEELGIPHFVVVDMGLTEIPPGTTTCAGFGPAPEEIIDKVTGTLRLLR